MTPISPPPRTRRDWTLPFVAGVLAVTVFAVLVICIAGTATVFVMSRGKAAPEAISPPIASPSVPVPPPTAKSQAQCLIGEWKETSNVHWADLFGARIFLRGKGSVMTFDGETSTWTAKNVVFTGAAQGKRYEVIFNTTITTNYKADESEIYYSNPRIEGTTVWKINGRVKYSSPSTASLGSDTYKCSGDDLRFYGDDYSSEWKRIKPPGVPA